MSSSNSYGIVIVGGGICGLATALALHRKGLDSLVLERSNTLRAAGAAIGVYSNGWCALDQLGVGMELRQKAFCLSVIRDVTLATSAQRETQISGKEELRCLKRSDLIETLANGLPPGSIRFGSQVITIGTDPITSFPVVHLHDGSIINAKVLIGCDGVNSIVAKSLGLKETKTSSIKSTRGFTRYPNGHCFDNVFLRLRGDGILFGLLPIDDKLVYWFVGRKWLPKDSNLQEDPELLRESTAELLKGYPSDMIEIVKNSDISSLSLTRIRYRAPWELILANLWKGTTTIAGDAMHVMGPFIGQGGSAGLEDAVVLARNLAQAMDMDPETEVSNKQLQQRVETAFDTYVKERKLRLLRLSTQSYLMGLMVGASSMVMRLLIFVLLIALFGRNQLSHTQYDCGRL